VLGGAQAIHDLVAKHVELRITQIVERSVEQPGVISASPQDQEQRVPRKEQPAAAHRFASFTESANGVKFVSVS
jgi:hypothetical protein